MGAIALLAALCCALPAAADQPLLRPTSDVDVLYRAVARGGAAIEQRVRWLAAAQTMRIDPPGRDLHVIVDYAARRMSVVQDATRSVTEMAAPNSVTDVLGGRPSAATYTRRGQATVAGRPCTEWQTQDREAHPALICITPDGVMLRAGTPEEVRVSAVSVQYAPQDPAAFRIPPDYARRPAGAAR